MSEYYKEWKATADSEYKSLIENETWDLVEIPVGEKLIGCKWVFKVRHASDGTVERLKGRLVEHFKGRLVAKGFAQTYGINYFETLFIFCQSEH